MLGLLLVALYAGSSSTALGQVPFTVTADRLTADVRARRYHAEGNAVLERAGTVVRASSITFDEETGEALAEGDVVVIDEKSVLFCRSVKLAFPGTMGILHDAELHIKSGIPEDVRARLSDDQLRDYGTDRLLVRAEKLERETDRRFEVEGGLVSTCDCGNDEAPTWSVQSSHASVDLDSGALLLFPVFRAKGIPFFVLPAFYVPLGPRRTGLLLPRLSLGSAVTGPKIFEPLFLTLGDSYDATIEPGFMFGRGPAGTLEFRWAPTPMSRGEFRFSGLIDSGVLTSSGTYARDRPTALHRFALSGKHTTRFEDGGGVAAELNFFGDPAYSEFSDRYLSRRAEVAFSRVTITSVADSAVRVAGGLSVLEDLRGESYAIPGQELRDTPVFSAKNPGPGAIRYRFAELRLDAPPAPLLDDSDSLLGGARLVVHAFAAPSPELARFVRADLRPEIAAPLSIGGLFGVEPHFALRMTGWAGHDRESVSATRLALIGGLRAATDIHRNFGDVHHSIRPEIAYTLIPFVERAGDDVFQTFDEIDRLEPIQQVAARIVTDLIDRASARRYLRIAASLGYDLDFGGIKGLGLSELLFSSETDLTRASSPIRVAFEGRLAFDVEAGQKREGLAGVSFNTRRGDLIALRYGDFAKTPPRYPLVGPEELVPALATPLLLARWNAFRALFFSGRTRIPMFEGWGYFDLGVDATVVVERPESRPVILFGPHWLRDTRTSLVWTSSCECFGIGATVITDRTRPGFEFAEILLSLGALGSVSDAGIIGR